MISRFLILALALTLPVQAQNKLPLPELLPGLDPALNKLAQRKDIVSWRLLAQVMPVKVNDRTQPQFSDAVLALDQKIVKVQGFMLPLDISDKQTRFLLSPTPQSCPFHLHVGGAESLIEVRASRAVTPTYDAVVMVGKLTVLKADPDGILYRLTGAVESK